MKAIVTVVGKDQVGIIAGAAFSSLSGCSFFLTCYNHSTIAGKRKSADFHNKVRRSLPCPITIVPAWRNARCTTP